jgi:cell division protein FtsZ
MESGLKFNMPKERASIIKVLGVGGGGSNAVNYMYSQGIKGVDFIVCNTDLQALEASPIPTKIQLGANLTAGLGAGSNPEVGKNSAMEAIEDIIDMLGVNTKMVFITAGMGGGTGTGAAPIIAKTAREMDILTVGIVTTPFSFEGKRRMEFAKEGMEALKNSVDCLLIISNDKIKDMYGNLPVRQAFAHANDILNTAAKGIAEVITYPGEINVDFEDVRTVMRSSGVALMGSATASGDNRALEAVRDALSSPLLNDSEIRGAKNILLNISSAPGAYELLMDEFSLISDYIQEESGFSAEMIIGTSYDEHLEDKIAVTIIATGFESGPKVNKIIVGNVDERPSPLNAIVPKPTIVEPTINAIQNNPVSPNKLPIPPAEIRFSLDDEIVAPKKEEVDPMDFSLRIEDSLEEELPQEPMMELEFEQDVTETQTTIFDVMQDTSTEEQEKKIEKHIQRIKTLKDLNISIKTPQGLRDLEKEPAYKRRLKRLDEVPHSSASQVSRLSLFDDNTGRPEIKSNNSFLHDNVD